MASGRPNKKLIAALLLSGAFVTVLNQTLMITAIPPIMQEMNITANTAQWLTTVFMLVNGIMIPISAFLIEKFTTRQLFLTAMGTFAVGTVIGGIAMNFEVLLIGRIIQSAGAGVMLPLMQTVFLLIFPVEKRGTIMGFVGLTISFAPAIGPTLSGVITETLEWRYLFWLILPMILIITAVSYRILENVTDLKNPKVDPISIILSSIGFGGLLYGFTSAGNFGWTENMTLMSFAVSSVALYLFIRRQLGMKHPMLEFRVFKLRTFTLATIIGMIGFLGLIGLETIIPLYMQNMLGNTAMQAGLVLFPGAMLSGIMSPITGYIFDKIGARALAFTGLTIMTVATAGFVFVDLHTTMAVLAILFALRMFGFSMVMMPVTTSGLNELPRKLIPHGAAMNNTMRQIAASVGTALLVTIMTTTAQTVHVESADTTADIVGVNIATLVITVLTFIGLILAFFLHNTRPMTDEEWDEREGTKDPDAQTDDK
ncbi:MDR family MFS transporter [Salisediminibacterium halotolerans]|uniref:MDR family MFS transporter n=1 Tax=Salisediminibacterium halotolerans TaxID=517425 RepID=UPI000EB19A0D|nr:MDR family MFS transporter [Salisediminibacterium halotolerans]RLJ71740.1 EmrB/QacA subfamily drug resistance transporter [Actinophytocola xinjiangensis]RPE86890.1 EmrB/QacA subfamily drug resistance transporter [Salisediminibacterium halotolerans]TWG32953.1 EmrB/QacA subfamily drug resistance transporter [Salisediminibacterium halotolerans]GEL09207.1 putative MFS-type transporter YcnB [Salisediminibacterium halotolerans]